jgi:hypothetical protein
MKIFEIMKAYSSSLYMVKHDGYAYVIDGTRESDEGYDYGIWNKISLEELKQSSVNFSYIIPETSLNSTIDFLLQDDLPNHYKVNKDTVSKLSEEPLDNWIGILNENNYPEVAKELEELYGCGES